MKRLFIFSAVVFLFLSNISCSNDSNDSNSNITTFKATLIPITGVESSAYGNASLEFNEKTKKFIIVVNFTNIVPTSGHIHAPDGAIVFDLSPTTSPLISPTTYISPELNADQVSLLMSNKYYINLHTAAHPNGEISGFLLKSGTNGDDIY